MTRKDRFSRHIIRAVLDLADVAVEVTDTAGVTNEDQSLSDAKGDIRSVPINNQTAAYTLVAADAGKCVRTTSGDVTVPAGVFTAGQSISIFNASAGDINIVSGSGITMYLVGDASTGDRVLAVNGLATVFCVAADTFVCTGGGVS